MRCYQPKYETGKRNSGGVRIMFKEHMKKIEGDISKYYGITIRGSSSGASSSALNVNQDSQNKH